MPKRCEHTVDTSKLKRRLLRLDYDKGIPRGWLFYDVVVYLDEAILRSSSFNGGEDLVDGETQDRETATKFIATILRFGGATISEDLEHESLTHVIVDSGNDRSRDRANDIRKRLQQYGLSFIHIPTMFAYLRLTYR